MSKYNFRIATLNDLDPLIELRILMQEEVNGAVPEASKASYREKLRSYFTDEMSNGSYFSAVAEVDGKIVSCNGMCIYRKPPSITGGTGWVGYISNVYTKPEFRGKRLASELMKRIIDQARQLGVDKLHLGASEMGKGVYERVGFGKPRFVPLDLKL
jgi:GNAT superfamily N-acetyltransferase